MTDPRPRCLVLTLYTGENEFERCREALRSQTYGAWEHRVFENLPNKEAHEKLYSTIMDSADEFSLFVKLDADMVLAGPEVLEGIVGVFAADADLDHAMFELSDFMSDGPLMALHAFSNRVRWKPSAEGLFVDPDPSIEGHRRMVRESPAPVAFHAPDPSSFQAFHFGVHRALKAFQRGRRRANHDQVRKQWRLLTRVWDHFVRTRDPRLGLAILGADRVWIGRIGPGGAEFDDETARREFERCAGLDAAELFRLLRGRWQPGFRRATRWTLTAGIKMAGGLLRSRLLPVSRSSAESES